MKATGSTYPHGKWAHGTLRHHGESPASLRLACFEEALHLQRGYTLLKVTVPAYVSQ